MCRAGGPRCKGNGRGGPKATVTTTTSPTTSTGAPGREDAERLAAELPADRKGWDGKPLNERDRRFFALRESGYSGPIDQDGYAATTGEAAGILRRMAEDRGETVNW